MKLTQEQLDFFDTFGYLMIRQLFSQDETDKIIQGFEWSIQIVPAAKIMTGRLAPCFWDPSNTIRTCVGSWITRQFLV